MIWTIEKLGAFQEAFMAAGEPDQVAIDAYLAHTGHRHPPQKRPGVKRWYYLLEDDPRVRLSTVGMPLDAWVGVNEIVGEFAGNRHLMGKKGLQIQLSPLSWLFQPGDAHFIESDQALETISFQILDLDTIEQSQVNIAQKYQWRK